MKKVSAGSYAVGQAVMKFQVAQKDQTNANFSTDLATAIRELRGANDARLNPACTALDDIRRKGMSAGFSISNVFHTQIQTVEGANSGSFHAASLSYLLGMCYQYHCLLKGKHTTPSELSALIDQAKAHAVALANTGRLNINANAVAGLYDPVTNAFVTIAAKPSSQHPGNIFQYAHGGQ